MKVTVHANTGLLRIETEKLDDMYQIGRIAMKFKTKAQDYPQNQRSVELPILQVLKELAE